MVIIIAATVIVLLVLWVMSCRRRLIVMDENINNALVQINLQLSVCFNALTALLDLTKEYAAHEVQTMTETVKSCRSDISATFTPDDVLKRECVIAETLNCISAIAERYPDLKSNGNYAKCINVVDSYEKMAHTSCLIYNDSVNKLNRELRMLPTSLIAGALGFRQRDYLELVEDKTDIHK